jgi:hypothetical protein
MCLYINGALIFSNDFVHLLGYAIKKKDDIVNTFLSTIMKHKFL